ncbi:hypothetical protein, partial [Clostridium beijerinckii]|uniref:hypothetical protein n=1 Tax=Clostridium beijerinckii TaxID=1520 RepID=UPI001A9A3A51
MRIFIIREKRKQKKAHIGLMRMNLLHFKIHKTHSPRQGIFLLYALAFRKPTAKRVVGVWLYR